MSPSACGLLWDVLGGCPHLLGVPSAMGVLKPPLQMDTAGLQVPQRGVHTQGAQSVGSVGPNLGHSPCPV